MRLIFTRDEIEAIVTDYANAILSDHIDEERNTVKVRNFYDFPQETIVEVEENADEYDFKSMLAILEANLRNKDDRIDFLKDTLLMIDELDKDEEYKKELEDHYRKTDERERMADYSDTQD